jgi:hypothetical protein
MLLASLIAASVVHVHFNRFFFKQVKHTFFLYKMQYCMLWPTIWNYKLEWNSQHAGGCLRTKSFCRMDNRKRGVQPVRNAPTNENKSSARENSKIAPNIVCDCHVKMWTKNSYKYISTFNPTQNMLITLTHLFRPRTGNFFQKIWILSRDPACPFWRHFYLRPFRFLAVGAWHPSPLEHLPQFCTTCLTSSQPSGLADLLNILAHSFCF